MSLFLDLLVKVLPLYFIIAMGFSAGRFMGVSHKQIADFTIYFVNPVVLFCMIWQANLNQLEALLLPLSAVAAMLVMAGLSYIVGSIVWKDKHKNLLSGQLMNGNSGYFGVPVAFALFPEAIANLWILIMLISTVLQVSLGYFIFATGKLSPVGGLRRLLKLPPFYAMILGLLVNFSGAEWPTDLNESYAMFKGAFFVMGMSIIGLSLAKLSRSHFDMKYISVASILRFALWPALVFGFIVLDRNILGWMDTDFHGLLMLFSILPIAADSAAYSAQLDLFPEKAASAILITTLIALIYIPAVMVLFLN